MQQKDVERIRTKVQDEVNKIDPWYLIEISAPEDEYGHQVDRIVSFLVNKKPGFNELKSELLSVFSTNEHKLDEKKIELLADKILEYSKDWMIYD